MKLLLDSSSSLLFSLLLAQLPVFTSASPVPQRRPSDMDKLSNQTRNLMKLTQELLREHAFDSDVEPHRFRSLPEMGNRSANDLSNLELKSTLSQLHADLKLYEHHFEWLNKVSKKHHHPAVPKLVEMIREMKSLISLLHRQMQRVEAPRMTPATPSLPLTSPISLTCYSPAMSFFNTSSSSAIGRTEHSSASSPKLLQYNDDP